MHELGHNLNLAHSGGLDRQTYTDHTGLMGNPLWEDDVGRMCFNPVKNFQIAKGGQGWYDDKHFVKFNSGTTSGTSWLGKIIGVADYSNNPSNHPIVLELETGGANWFIGFNRATGINADVHEAENEVTIYKVQSGDGTGYSTSSLKVALGSGRSVSINKWRNSLWKLVINVREINTTVSPAYATVEITFGPQSANTPQPTARPSVRPTIRPTIRPTAQPTSQPTNEPTVLPTKQPTIPPTQSPTPKPTVRPTVRPTAQPTSQPTNEPTVLPTKQPTIPPTQSPTPKPTVRPTVRPTAQPTSQPTNEPTVLPTKQPIIPPTQPPTRLSTASGIRVFDSGTLGGKSWSGSLIASGAYSKNNNNSSNRPTTIQLISGDASDWFVGFNNMQVTIIEVKDGTQYFLKGALIAGNSATITNWRDSGLDLVVKVHQINTNASPEYANVEITFGTNPSPSKEPAREPTAKPTAVAIQICPDAYNSSNASKTYKAGSQVEVDAVKYQCKGTLFAFYCALPTFRPKSEDNSLWSMAWEDLGPCSNHQARHH